MAKIKAGKELKDLLKCAADIKKSIADANFIIETNISPAAARLSPGMCRASVTTELMCMRLILNRMLDNGYEGLLEGCDEYVSDSDTGEGAAEE